VRTRVRENKSHHTTKSLRRKRKCQSLEKTHWSLKRKECTFDTSDFFVIIREVLLPSLVWVLENVTQKLRSSNYSYMFPFLFMHIHYKGTRAFEMSPLSGRRRWTGWKVSFWQKLWSTSICFRWREVLIFWKPKANYKVLTEYAPEVSWIDFNFCFRGMTLTLSVYLLLLPDSKSKSAGWCMALRCDRTQSGKFGWILTSLTLKLTLFPLSDNGWQADESIHNPMSGCSWAPMFDMWGVLADVSWILCLQCA
jgi:hypothetical protein